MVKCKRVDFYSFVWRLKTVEKYEVEAKEVKGVLKAEVSTVKPTTKVVEVKAR